MVFWMASTFFSVSRSGGLLLLVFGERSEHYVGNGALLLVAELFGLVHITLLKGRFHSGSKFAEVTFTVSRADGEPTFDSECNNRDEEGPDDGHDETTLVDRTYDTGGFITLVLEEMEGKTRGILRAVEVSEVTGTKDVETFSNEEADDDYCKAGLDARKAFFGGSTRGCRSICSCHLDKDLSER